MAPPLTTELPLADRTISQVGELLRRRETSSRELTDACLARIDRDAERLNTFLSVGRERALAAADAADAALARGEGEGRPLLGICLGLQWLFEGSSEAPDCQGLALMTGQCERLKPEWPFKVPHVGWNELEFPRASRLFEGIRNRAQVYFTHSYAAPVTDEATAVR